MPKQSLNINSFARLAGVSTATVSNFINGTGAFPISREKEEKLHRLMLETGYRPNSSSTLIRRKKELPLKGIFLYGDHVMASVFSVIQNPMLSPLLNELSSQLKAEFNSELEVRSIQDENSLAQWNEVLIGAEYVINYGQLDSLLANLCWRKNIPLVLVSASEKTHCRNGEPLPPGLDHVYWDNGSHLDRTMDFLRARGVSRFTYISSTNVRENHPGFWSVDAQARLDHFRSYLQRNPELTGNAVITKEPPDNAGFHPFFWEQHYACSLLMARPDWLSQTQAIVAHHDLTAAGVINALLMLGLRPGRDILVAGEGNFLETSGVFPGITTVAYDRRKMAGEICRLLKKRMAGAVSETGERIFMEGSLYERESSGTDRQ